MNKYLLIGLLLLFLGTEGLSAATKKLSEQAQVSVLIGEPYGSDLFSMFGHTAIRISDPELKIDYAFNFGVPRSFSAGTANFFRMIQKNFPVEMYAIQYAEIEQEYMQNKRSLNELALNYSQEEKESLWQSILKIAQSGGKVSYYNFFDHNCTAFPLTLLEENTAGTIQFPQKNTGESYRSYSNSCLHEYPWSSFAMNISLGWATDYLINFRKSFFLPKNFEEGLLSATVVDSLGNMHPLIVKSHYLVSPTNRPSVSHFFTPALCAWLLLAVVILLSGIEWKRKRLMRPVDVLLFTIAGIGGCYLFYIQFIVPQWYTFPSWWILWLHPLHLLGAAWSANKRFDRLAVYYHIFNLCALGVMVIGTCFVPQYYHPAFAPLMLVLALRSALHILYGWQTKR